MKSIPLIALFFIFILIGLAVWRELKEEAKTEQLKDLKEQVMHSIYIDSVRTRTVMDSLGQLGKQLHKRDSTIDAYNKAERARNIKTRKQNETLVLKIDSLHHSLASRPEF